MTNTMPIIIVYESNFLYFPSTLNIFEGGGVSDHLNGKNCADHLFVSRRLANNGPNSNSNEQDKMLIMNWAGIGHKH